MILFSGTIFSFHLNKVTISLKGGSTFRAIQPTFVIYSYFCTENQMNNRFYLIKKIIKDNTYSSYGV